MKNWKLIGNRAVANWYYPVSSVEKFFRRQRDRLAAFIVRKYTTYDREVVRFERELESLRAEKAWREQRDAREQAQRDELNRMYTTRVAGVKHMPEYWASKTQRAMEEDEELAHLSPMVRRLVEQHMRSIGLCGYQG